MAPSCFFYSDCWSLSKFDFARCFGLAGLAQIAREQTHDSLNDSSNQQINLTLCYTYATRHHATSVHTTKIHCGPGTIRGDRLTFRNITLYF